MMQIQTNINVDSNTPDEINFSSRTDNPKENMDRIFHSIQFRAMILFQIIAYGSYSILVHLCEKNGMISFSSTTLNFILEFVKLIFSLTALMCSQSIIYPTIGQFIVWFRQSLPYSIPGILYFINNNLAVHMQLQMDPASYQILANFKVLTTAILYRLIMKQKLSRKKWFALSLLFFGGVAYSLGRIRFSIDFLPLNKCSFVKVH